jgi:hypothetical protein
MTAASSTSYEVSAYLRVASLAIAGYEWVYLGWVHASSWLIGHLAIFRLYLSS